MRRLLITTIAALAALGGVAFAMHAHSRGVHPKAFTFSVTPARQSVARGASVSFSVNMARRSFTGNTRFRTDNLPRGIRVRWRLDDGTRSRVVPSGDTGVTLTLRTSRRTPLGTRRIRLLAGGGGTTASRRLTLTVVRPRLRRFSLRVKPARQIVAQGSGAQFKVRVARAAGFRRRVKLRVLRLGQGASASWAGRTLTVATNSSRPLGSDRLVIRGVSRVGHKTVRRYAVIVLTVVDARPFGISGDLKRTLRPGVGGALNLVLTNPYSFDIRVVALRVSVRARTSKPGCSGAVNYAVTQYSGGYPLVLHPGSTTLSALRSSGTWPTVAMHNLPINQDACQRAVLALDYRGLAIR